MTSRPSPFAQLASGVRFDWGLSGAQAVCDHAGELVIVDVLSFTTAVTVVIGRGATVYPNRPDYGEEAFAAAHHAVCAVRRSDVSADHPWSLSPAHLLSAPAPRRLVLPSPNGSTIAASVPAGDVLAGCLRNATAIGEWLTEHEYGSAERPAAVIAAGEQWPSGDLRPALEDLLGAGAIIAALPLTHHVLSPEAAAARSAWLAHRHDINDLTHRSASGQELIGAGYASDVTIAMDHDSQDTIPGLVDGAFRQIPADVP